MGTRDGHAPRVFRAALLLLIHSLYVDTLSEASRGERLPVAGWTAADLTETVKWRSFREDEVRINSTHIMQVVGSKKTPHTQTGKVAIREDGFITGRAYALRYAINAPPETLSSTNGFRHALIRLEEGLLNEDEESLGRYRPERRQPTPRRYERTAVTWRKALKTSRGGDRSGRCRKENAEPALKRNRKRNGLAEGAHWKG